MSTKHITRLLVLVILFLSVNLNAQESTPATNQKYKISFDAGLMMGNTQLYFPNSFTSHASVLTTFANQRIYAGLGTGAEIIGKSFLPAFADVRLVPLASKPVYVYGKLGYAFCIAQNSFENSTYNYRYDYLPSPHYMAQNIKTFGGAMGETGFGIILKRSGWESTVSLGYRYQKTRDEIEQTNKTLKTYEHYFHRIAFRVGFMF
jgi:hypothetical protein